MKKCLSLVASSVVALSLAASGAVPQAPLRKLTAQSEAAATVSHQSPAKVSRAQAQMRTKLSRLQSRFFDSHAPARKKAPRPVQKAPKPLAADDPQGLFGYVTYSDTQETGLYDVSVNGQSLSLITTNVESGYGGYDNGDGVYYSVSGFSIFGFSLYYLTSYDTDTWEELSSVSTTATMAATDVALDPTTGDVYGCFQDETGQGFVWGVADYEAGTCTAIAPIEMLFGVAIDRNGQAYGVTIDNDLVKIDKATGEFTVVGATGLDNYYLVSSAIDSKTGRMYHAYSPEDGSGWLAEIDLTTGKATLLYQFEGNDELCNLQFPAVNAEDKAPAQPAISVTAPEGTMTATITVTAPTTLFDGSSASGSLTYTISCDGEEIAAGQTTYGATITASYTVETAGYHTFTAQVGNSVGKSPAAKEKIFVGQGTPSAPQNAYLLNYGNMYYVTWTAVTSSADGGYLDPTKVTYDVFDADGNPVELGMTDNEMLIDHETIVDLTIVQFSIVANYNGQASPATKTNVLVLGEATPPVTCDFNDPNEAKLFTVVDANGDGRTWSYSESNGCMAIPYSATYDMDDYLISMPLKLKAGEAYQVSFDAFCASLDYGCEVIEVRYGDEAAADAMTHVLLPPTDITGLYDSQQKITVMLTPEADGVYYVGIHGVTPVDRYNLYIDNFAVAAGLNTAAPAQPTDLVLIPASDGSLTGTLTCKAPATDFAGNPITSLTQIEVTGPDGTTQTTKRPQPGREVTFNVEATETGYNTFTVTAYNESGAGESATVSAYFGYNAPAAPTNVNIRETETLGTVTLTWDATTTDVDGLPVHDVTYNVYTVNGQYLEPVRTGLTDTTLTADLVAEGEQDFVQLYVAAVNGGVEGDLAVSPMIAAGTPYQMPFDCSFNDESFDKYILGIDTTGGGSWGIGSSALGVPALDDDDSFLTMSANVVGAYGSCFTGKIDLSDSKMPVISVWEYKVADTDANSLVISLICDGEATQMLSTNNTEAPVESGWYEHRFTAPEFAGKVVQVMLTPTIQTHVYCIFDLLTVTEALDNDLQADELTAPSSVEPGQDFEVTLTVSNRGANTADNFSVELFKNGELTETLEVATPLAAGQSTTVKFAQTLTMLDNSANTYMARVTTADDNMDNNTSNEVTVNLVESSLAGVTDLAATETADGLLLSWSAPTELTPDAVTESFEDYEAYATEFDGWTNLDVDGKPIGGIQGVDMPNTQTPQPFFVIDSELLNVASLQAHSGTKFAATMFNYNPSEGLLDDWLISPELYGGQQTVTFFARSYHSDYTENFQVLYSTGSLDPADFIALTDDIVPPALISEDGQVEYVKYSVTLPEGAKYFAIRNHDVDGFIFMVDDISYCPAGGASSLEIMGYNVYRDSEKLNEAPIQATEYLDTQAYTDARYFVTVVFNAGESRKSNIVSYTSGIADMTVAATKVAVDGHNIVVTGSRDSAVVISTADGRQVATANGDCTKAVAPGIYLVKAGNTVAKVIVK